MSEIWREDWRNEHGVSERQMNMLLDEAARVIRSSGELVPVSFELKRSDYRAILTQPFKKRIKVLEPDHLGYLWFAMTELLLLYERYGSEVEKVDFWAEENGRMTKRMHDFHKELPDNLRSIGHDELAPLVGEFLPVSKERIPVQAADALAWHTRNHSRKALNRDGERRYWRMVEGGYGTNRGRYGHCGEVTHENLRDLADRFEGRLNGSISDEAAS
jgi:hypothetical protein